MKLTGTLLRAFVCLHIVVDIIAIYALALWVAWRVWALVSR